MDALPAYRYELFVSYVNADRAWVEGYLFDALRGANIRFLSEAAFELGTPRLAEFERAIQQSQRTLLVLSPVYLADSANEFFNLLAQTYGLESSTWQVIPLVLQSVHLPPRLAMLTYLDATDPTQYETVLQRLLDALQHPLPSVAVKPACPYPGMVPFREADSARFFGRSRDVENLLQQLRLHPFLTVIGPSGSGKSSLVFAGLIPALRKSTLFGLGNWVVKSLRPGEDPLGALTNAFGNDPSNLQPGVKRQIESQPNGSHLLLVVDQFEEVFTVAKQNTTAFQEALLQLAKTPDCFLVITVRADFYPELMASPLWFEIQAHRVEVLPLDDESLREAIVRPAEDVGVFVETALVERLVADAAGEPGILPLIQETFVLLWEKVERRFLPLRAYDSLILPRSAYGAMGVIHRSGLQVAIALRADSVYNSLPPAQLPIARRIFLRLIQFGEGRADTRRQQTLATLHSSVDALEAFEMTVECLTENRLLTMTGAEKGAERSSSKVDIAHEALITAWPLLQTWLHERRDAEQIRRRLENHATEWVRLGRGEGGLFDPIELLEADRWLSSADATELGYDEALPALAQKSHDAIEAEEKSKKEQQGRERQQLQQIAEEQSARARDQAAANKRLKQRALVLTIVSAVAGILMLAAAFFAREANQQSEEAIKQSSIALSRQLAVQSTANLDTQYDLALLLSVEAQRNANTQEAQASQLRALLFNQPLQIYLYGHSSAVTSVAFSSDDQILASADTHGTLILWDQKSHSVLHQIATQQTGHILRLAFTPDGEKLISISYGNSHTAVNRPSAQAMVWDVASGNLIKQLASDSSKDFYKATISKDGRVIAFVNQAGEVIFWDTTKDSSIGSTSALGYEPSLALDKDGQELTWVAPVTTNTGNVISLGEPVLGRWNIANQSGAEPELIQGHANLVDSISLSIDNRFVATASYDGSVLLYEYGNPIAIATFRNSTWLASIEERGMAFNSDNKLFAYGDGGGGITVYDLVSKQQFGEKLKGHSGDILSLAFSRNGNLLAAGGQDGKVTLWDLDSQRLQQHFDNAQSIIFNQTGDTLAVLNDKTINLYKTDSGAPIGEPVLVEGISRLWKFFPDGQTIVASDYPGGYQTFLWNIKNGKVDGLPIQHPTSRQDQVALSPNGKILVTTSGRGDTWLFVSDLPGRKRTVLKYGQTAFTNIDFSPDSSMLASGSWDGKILLWDMTTRALKMPPIKAHDDWISSIAFSPDGKYVASGGGDRLVKIWDISTGERYGPPLVGHKALIRGLAFSSDGSILASSGDDGQLILWDVKTSRILGQLPAFSDQVMFDPRSNQNTLANGNTLWKLDSATWSDLICKIANRNLSFDEWNRFVGSDKPYELTCLTLPIHPSLLAHAQELARTGRTKEAVSEFQYIMELQPALKLNPEAEVKRLSDQAHAQQLITEARNLALRQQVSDAIEKYQEALHLDPTLNMDATKEAKRIANLVSDGVALSTNGQITEAIADFDEAQSIDPVYKIPGPSWNQLCRNASLSGHAWDIVNTDACNLAVEQAANPAEAAQGHDSRGIAFTLANWDRETAMADFQAYLEWSKQNGLYEKYGQKREAWIQAIEAGQMPFDEATLDDIRNEQ